MHIKFKNLCNASKHMNMHITNATKVHELAPPTCVLLLSKNFDPSPLFNIAPSLSMSNYYFSPMMHLHIFDPTSPPLSSISIKGVLLIDTKDCIRVDGWHLNLAFLWTSLDYWNDTTCIASWDTTYRIFDLDTNWCDTSPYVIAWVIHLIILISCRWGNFLHLMIT